MKFLVQVKKKYFKKQQMEQMEDFLIIYLFVYLTDFYQGRIWWMSWSCHMNSKHSHLAALW